MRLLIEHKTEYRFTEPQSRVVQMLRMTPDSHIGQNIINWRIDVDCDARLKRSRDGFGNIVSMLYLQGPVERIGLSVSGEVLTEDRAGVVTGANEPLPSTVYSRPTELTAPGALIEQLVRAHGGATKPLTRAHELNTAIHEIVRHRPERSTEIRPALDILKDASGCSMDMAHVLIAAARTAGFAARFVTGYIYSDNPDAAHRQAPHFWAEIDVPDYGWIAFDPANDVCPQECYVRVARGLDYRDAAPISGARIGGGHEVLNVGVGVTLSQGQNQG